MKKYLLFVFISFIGFAFVYWFWPKNEALPILDKVSSFQIEDVHGSVYDSKNDKIKIVTFFYTHCPDICPLTMVDLQDLQEELKIQGLFGKKVELVAITFDPKNDTAQVIKEYARAFQVDPSGWKWLRGTPEETKLITNQLKMHYQEFEEGLFTHTTTMYLMDQNHQIRALYNMALSNKPIEQVKILEDIDLLLGG